MSISSPSRCKALVLDAGPLLSLSPLRGLAETYLTVPQVLDELKDKRAREHFEKLGLSSGVKIEVREADKFSLAHVIQFAKKTGDYTVLSYADLCVLALVYSLDVHAKEKEEKAEKRVDFPVDGTSTPHAVSASQAANAADEGKIVNNQEALSPQTTTDPVPKPPSGVGEHEPEVEVLKDERDNQESLDVELHLEAGDDLPRPCHSSPQHPPNSQPDSTTTSQPLYDDPSDSDDGEGEWITPSNVALHKCRALDLLPSASARRSGRDEIIDVGCMTADFAMQNVMLQMGLNLVSVDGKKIDKVKSWVLRCHACFKICKDNSKQFCPSCGNPTLLRASVTITSPTASTNTPAMQVHLKPNFQYRTRGTIYSIPSPKPGSAKTGPGEGLILREDQSEYMRARKLADGKKEREEKKMAKGIMGRGGMEGGVKIGSWMDPDWVPEIMSVGAGGQGRSAVGRNSDMPVIGYGRKNPNERRRKH